MQRKVNLNALPQTLAKRISLPNLGAIRFIQKPKIKLHDNTMVRLLEFSKEQNSSYAIL